MSGPCGQCVCAMGVWNGRRDWLLCTNYPGHEGELSHVSGTGIVTDCRRFSRKWEHTAVEVAQGEAVRYISLGHGRTVMVDPADFDWLNRHKWHAAGGSDYARATIGGKSVSMHRLIMNPPPGMIVDHISGNRHDNRRSNLRICTPAENLRNARKGRGTSRFKGVFWNAQRRKWGASIHRDGKNIWLGHFTDEVEAARAYDRAARELFGPFAYLNFPQWGNIVLLSGRICVHSRMRGRIQVVAAHHRLVGAGPCTCPGQPQGVAPATVSVKCQPAPSEAEGKRAARPVDERLGNFDQIKRFRHGWAFAPARGPPERRRNHALKSLD